MTEETAAAFQRDGDAAFATDSTAEDTAADSQSEGENQDEGAQSDGGKKPDGEKEPAFHEHPRWKEREDEWNKRFNDQETRHADDLKTIREEFGTARKDNAQQTKIPAWFGGTQEQWDAYRSDRDTELKEIETRAIAQAEKNLETKAGAGQKAVEEATTFMNSEVAAIEADATLNPTGAKIDREKLLKTVLDNELIDTKGRWNYRAGIRLMNAGSQSQQQITKKPAASEKKEVAAATTSEGRGDDKKPNFATSADFKKDRPW